MPTSCQLSQALWEPGGHDEDYQTGKESEQVSLGGQGGPPVAARAPGRHMSRKCWTLQSGYPPLPNQRHALLPPRHKFQSCPWTSAYSPESHLDTAYHRQWGRALEQQTGQERGGLEGGREAKVGDG